MSTKGRALRAAAALVCTLAAAGGAWAQSAPAADDAAYAKDLLARYASFLQSERNAPDAPSSATFKGHFVFQQSTCMPGRPCPCPPDNDWLQCLVSASVTIGTDPRDVNGRAYVSVMTKGATLDTSGNWSKEPPGEVYSAMVNAMPIVAVVQLPVPSTAAVTAACSASTPRDAADDPSKSTFPVIVGYGTVQPIQVEYAEYMQRYSTEHGAKQPINADQFLLSEAYVNGYNEHKYAEVGQVQCRPPGDSTSSLTSSAY